MNANNFYNIFINQTVSDDYILVPVVEGGYYIGKFLNHDILDSSMQKRRYAIEGLGLVDFKPAIKNLELIIENDDTEDFIREIAMESLIKLKEN